MNWTNFLLVLSPLNHDGFFVSFHSSNAIFIVITIIFDFEISKFLLGWRIITQQWITETENVDTLFTREKREKDFLEISSRILKKFFDDF